MKVAEFKLRILTGLNNWVDEYFGLDTINERLINTTLKLLIKQNSNKYDKYIYMFADENGEVNAHEIIESYSNLIGPNGVTIDLKQYVDNSILREFIPNKVLIIRKSDLLELIQ